MIRIDVPATSANLGSGFDSLGIALTMQNRVWMEESDTLEIRCTDGVKVPTDESNLIFWAAQHLYEICGKKLPGLKIIQENNIREDAVSTLTRTGLMTASLFSGNLQNLRVAVQDRIHQPYRSGLIDHYDDVFRMSYELGSLGTYVSGAGPTIIAMIDSENAQAFGRNCVTHLEDKGITGWRVEILSAAPQGAQIVIE